MKLHILIATAALLAPALAFADEAEDHIAKGTRYYEIADWPNALKEYKQAYTIDPKPETLWAIAQTQRQSGDCRGAILTYKAYLRGASAAGANAAEDLINKCNADLEAQQRASDEANKIQKDTAPPPPPKAPQPPRSRFRDPLGDTMFVIGLGGLVTGGVFLVTGNQDMDAAASAPTWQLHTDGVDAARTKQEIGVWTGIGGAVFIGLAVWRFASIDVGGEVHEKKQAFAPVLVPGGAMVTYDTRF